MPHKTSQIRTKERSRRIIKDVATEAYISDTFHRFREEYRGGNKQSLLMWAGWLMRWMWSGYKIPNEVIEFAKVVSRELMTMHFAFHTGHVDHLENHIGAKRHRYWRKAAEQRQMLLGYTVWREVKELRDRKINALDAFETVGRKHGLSSSLAQKWFYAEEHYSKTLSLEMRRRYANAQRLKLVKLASR